LPTRDTAPNGSPCWIDLWTSDVDGSRHFYAELLGWEAAEPSPEFGGYWMFLRDGVPVAGGMGPMGGDAPDNRWKPYLATADCTATLQAVERNGGMVRSPAMPVADLGVQAVFTDPAGASFGIWQAGTFPGFTVLGEHGAPSWFELHTSDYAGALDFYRACFNWVTDVISDTDEMRYSAVRDDGDGQVAGVVDEGARGTASEWQVYWHVDDVDAAITTCERLGGTTLLPANDTPYGRLAGLADPSGARFNLRSTP
jgi:predicted enzyme related to lactoylglutathione lyase